MLVMDDLPTLACSAFWGVTLPFQDEIAAWLPELRSARS
jgi:hypothetical protein